MPIKNLHHQTLQRIKMAVFCLALWPLVKLIIAGLLDNLGANPIEKITHHTGFWTLTMLIITLSLSPLKLLTGWLWLIRLRRMLGLFAFFYASLHFSIYLVLDQFFDWASIAKDLTKRPYISVGFPSFILMIPLALTSTDKMTRRLGGKRWRLLHRLVYFIAIGGVIHYAWLVKKDLTQPLIFGLLLMLLFGIRWGYWLKNRLRSKSQTGNA